MMRPSLKVTARIRTYLLTFLERKNVSRERMKKLLFLIKNNIDFCAILQRQIKKIEYLNRNKTFIFHQRFLISSLTKVLRWKWNGDLFLSLKDNFILVILIIVPRIIINSVLVFLFSLLLPNMLLFLTTYIHEETLKIMIMLHLMQFLNWFCGETFWNLETILPIFFFVKWTYITSVFCY